MSNLEHRIETLEKSPRSRRNSTLLLAGPTGQSVSLRDNQQSAKPEQLGQNDRSLWSVP